VLRGFSFALVVGILIGTYSSIAVAAPMLVAWQEWRAKQGKATVFRPQNAPECRVSGPQGIFGIFCGFSCRECKLRFCSAVAGSVL
jgi:hypothetical protein